mmetsp:Transcript_5106/g.14660  ORF Transcript_5106/g.14660 Transcript_5106/m.14660 type:complete len:431 (+) Transcript_5106:909-2201(+)
MLGRNFLLGLHIQAGVQLDALALLHRRVHVQDALVPRREDGLVLQQLHYLQLGLEVADHRHSDAGVAHHKAGLDVLLVYTCQPQPQVLTATRRCHLSLIREDSLHLNLHLVGHHEQRVALPHAASLRLAHDHGTQVLELVNHGHAKRCQGVPLRNLSCIQKLKQRRAGLPTCVLVPGRSLLYIYSVLDVVAVQAGDRHVHNVLLGVVPAVLQERGQLILNLFVPLLAPLPVGAHDGRLIHLVDRHNDLSNPQGLRQLSVLPRLPSTLKPCLELGLAGRNDQHTNVGERGPANHVGHIVFVPRRIQDGIPLDLRLKQSTPHLHGLSLGSLLLVSVHDVRHVPGLTVLFLSFPLILLDCPLVHTPRQVKDLATNGGFAGVNVPNEHHVHMFPRVELLHRIHDALLRISQALRGLVGGRAGFCHWRRRRRGRC